MKNLFSAAALLLLLVAAAPAGAQSTRPTPPANRPVPAIERVLIVSIDGARPDLLLRGDCPNVRALMADGSFTFWARTTAVSITLPSHVSMVTGVIPVRHGVHWNEDLALAKPYYPKVPTVFELAHKAGYTTALVTSKAKFDPLAKPGTLDWTYMHGDQSPASSEGMTMEQQAVKKSTASAELASSEAIHIITQHQPQLMMIHFADNDVAGHAKGWGSPEQIAAIERVDAALGRVLATLDKLGLREHTAIILSADHGGAVLTHGADDERSRHIPWILSGPGIRKNFDLTRSPDLQVNTYDTFATSCYLLGVKLPNRIDGKPILPAIEQTELLQSAK